MTKFTKTDWTGDFHNDVNKFIAANIDGLDFKSGLVEVDDEVYESMLGSVPPIYGEGFWANGEPVEHISEGFPMYHLFRTVHDKRYYIGLGTIDAGRLYVKNRKKAGK